MLFIISGIHSKNIFPKENTLAVSYKTFVSIGNVKKEFTRLLKAVEENLDLLPKPILIQRGHTAFEIKQHEFVEVHDFISMDQFIHLFQTVEILIVHAGAGSIMNAIKAKKIPIVMTRLPQYDEIINDHQVGFARNLQQEGRIMLIENSQELATAIQTQINKNNHSSIQETTSRAAEVIKSKLSAWLG
jgi:beta-1,4-N-acetylglucosaminyltransferase